MNIAMNRMKLILAAILFGGVSGCAAPSTSISTSPAGRYELAPGGNQVLDTTTGELFIADYNDGTWQKQIAPAATAKARPTTQSADETTTGQPGFKFPNAMAARGVQRNLQQLDLLRRDGVFTADEYAKARADAMSPFNHVQQLQLWNYGPERLHDELGLLKQMRDDGLITKEEYDRVRFTMVQSYLARE